MSQGKGGPEGLNPDDPGIRLLGAAVEGVDARSLLLVHCGEVPGVEAGAVRLILDVRERAGSVHRCVASIDELPPGTSFAHALVWPRAHLGKDFAELCLAQAALAVGEGGRVWMAARTAKGGKSLAKVLAALLGEVDVVARDRGYHLYRARRGPRFDHPLAEELLARSYELRDPLLGAGVGLTSAPGVFARKELDRGTAALIEVVDALARGEGSDGRLEPTTVLDLCAGVGPLAIASARRWPRAQVVAIDSNLRAVTCLRESVRRLDLAERVSVFAEDGVSPPRAAALRGRVDLALVNPPTHADADTLASLFAPLPACMSARGRAMMVVQRPGLVLDRLHECGARVHVVERHGYLVLDVRW